ncbi:MAG: bifunctional metallophosphatase/5'-nucleotidase, partial [Alistipes sp.]|nr:bifunctional metallophosphatase/5'-nucleotidase [Alistipes sp.]
MKKVLLYLLASLLLVGAGYKIWERYIAQRTLVIVSTTDIHSDISDLPRMATALKACRDTVETILVDAGDRWTGNAYVDMAT